MFDRRRPLTGIAPASPEVWAEVLDGGQAFRWKRHEDGWQGVFCRTVVRVYPGESGVPEFSCLKNADTAAVCRELTRYLDGAGDPLAAADALPWRSDAALAGAMGEFPGLRILRQPFPDALIGFICSANANIPRIKGMVESLAREFGDEIAPGVHATPAWARLARATDAELAPCKLGYRAGFIRATAAKLAADPDFEIRVAALPPELAREALMTLPGVGPKVADCVRLFGLGQLDAFPVDTWIRKVMDARYGLADWTNPQVVHFSKVHFGAHAGLAQQFLFASARKSDRA
jgi:N-glycosylase/DNA lyase